jgi:hypothetical protein
MRAPFVLTALERALPRRAAARASASVNLLLAVADMKREKHDAFVANLDSAVRTYGDATIVSMKFNTLRGRALTMLTEAVRTGRARFAATLLTRYRADPTTAADGESALDMILASREAFAMFGEALEAHARTRHGEGGLEAYVRATRPANADALARRRAETTRGRRLGEDDAKGRMRTVVRAEESVSRASATTMSVETIAYDARTSETTTAAAAADFGEASDGESEASSEPWTVENVKRVLREGVLGNLRAISDDVTEMEFPDEDGDANLRTRRLDACEDACARAEEDMRDVATFLEGREAAVPPSVEAFAREAARMVASLRARCAALRRDGAANADAPAFFAPTR